jgi:hypothetical protein
LGAAPKVLVTILSFAPGAANPHTITELSGMDADGIVVLVLVGGVVALTSKVSTPDVLTLYCVTGLPLKSNAKGILAVLDHSGVAVPPGYKHRYPDETAR